MATMLDVKNYFGYKVTAEFSADWKALSDKDKEQLKSGIEDGTYNY